ncbi:MAG TPA: PAS domain S-box protein [Gemmatimonadales bacterium]|nr:PAS domain S-box protein [Gemmatimonadales bacterium]
MDVLPPAAPPPDAAPAAASRAPPVAESDELLAAIVDSSNDAIVGKRFDGTILSWNPAAERIFGYSAAEMIGGSIFTLVPPELQEEERELLRRLSRGEATRHYETVRVRRDGARLAVSLSLSPIRDRHGVPVGAASIQRDITAEKRAQEAQARLAAIVESSNDAIVGKTLDGIITSWNAAAERLYGYRAQEIIGRSASILTTPDHPDEVPMLLERLKRGERVELYETTRRRKDGTTVDVSLTFSPVRDARGRLIGASVIARDITERNAAAAALRRQAEELARSNAELERFAYIASHDLQEPLRIVSQFAQLLARRYRGRLGADADDFIGFIVDGVTRMQTLISDLLAYARVNEGGRDFSPTDCNAVLAWVLEGLEPQLREIGAEVRVDPLPTAPADAALLRQLFQNLVGNAIKFRGAAPLRVTVSAVRDGAHWRFTVRDNGLGIPAEYHEQIFQLFRRFHDPGRYPGTGIGLAISRRIVEQHGGRMWVESAPGQGAAFHFTIPAEAES